MRVLLDTHALFWFIEDDPKLSTLAAETISDLNNEILVSSATYWEIAIKVSLGKWQLNHPYEEFLDLVFKQYGFTILPISPEHTAGLLLLPYHHRDPFDRLLIAQSMTEQIPIISVDCQFDNYKVKRIW